MWNKDDNTQTINEFNVGNMMLWKNGKYIFNNMPFEEIADILQKGFGVVIRIEKESLKTKPFTGKFENDETLENILNLIKINAKYTYEYNNGDIVIK
jgi:ferric-dicitrate binding protein FerR (iron transport regulator)